jgi:hypothetical protein
MLLQARKVIFTVFFISVVIAICSGPFLPDNAYVIALVLYWFFSSLYSHLRVVDKTKSNIPVDYGINYSLSFAIFAGPFGLFIFEALFRLTEHVTKKWMKTAEPDEWLQWKKHTFTQMNCCSNRNSSGKIGYRQKGKYPYKTISGVTMVYQR